MAFDKVVDSSVLDAGLKAIADAIREKGGTTGNLEFPADMAEAIAAIEAGDELPTLEHPATEADVVSSKQFIDESGNLRTGSMGLLGFGGIVDAYEDVEISENDDGSKTLMVGGYTTNTENKYVKPGASVIVMMDETHEGMSVFGDAKPEDVVAGKIFTSKEGFAKVGTHACSGGAASGNPIILEVEKITSDTNVNDTDYTEEVFVLLDIYPKSGGTVNVTYGGLTKTVTDISGEAKPGAHPVYFGTFGGVTDSTETPASGTLTIEGDYAAFGCGIYNDGKNDKPCCCVTEVVSCGDIEYLPSYAFGHHTYGGCEKITNIHLPRTLKDIGSRAFASCINLRSLAIPYGVTEIKSGIASWCYNLREIVIPNSVTIINNSAFSENFLPFITIPESVTEIEVNAFAYSTALRYIRILATTPPVIGNFFGPQGVESIFEGIIVPYGCAEAYKTSERWSEYVDYIIEDAKAYDPEEDA